MKSMTRTLIPLIVLLCLSIVTGTTQGQNLLNTLANNTYSKTSKVPLNVVLKEFEQRYNVSFLYKSSAVKGKYVRHLEALSGDLPNKLDQVLKPLHLKYSQISPASYAILQVSRPEKTTYATIYQQTITGTVTDATSGGPLPGVNVVVKGTTTGTATDTQGKYSLDVPESADSLVFSYIGYSTKVVPINGRTVINVKLKSEAISGGQLVVVGYGTQEKKEITGAISNVDSSSFNKGEINNVAKLIQGKVAGLSISKPGSDPNGGYNIRLRGISTLGSNQEPLIVVDGVPGASLSSVDPNDVKSVDVLKDASASAIYGTRGSNGVIIITTKSGASTGKTNFSVEYHGSATVETPYRRVKVMSAGEYRNFLQYWKQYTGNDFTSNDYGHSNNWFDMITHTGLDQVHDLALSGGNQSTNYRFSINYRDVSGILKNSGFEQINTRLNINQRALNDKLTINGNFSIIRKNAQLGFSQAFRYATIFKPTAPVNDPNAPQYGDYFQEDLYDMYNPVSIVQQDQNNQKIERLDGSIKGEYDFSDIISGLSLSGFYAENHYTSNSEYFAPSTEKWAGYGSKGTANRYEDNSVDRLVQATAHYNHTVAQDLNLEALAGWSWQQFTNDGFHASGGNFLSNHFGYNNLGAALDFENGLGNVGSYENLHLLKAYFGRLNLDFKNTYLLSGSVRREFSSRFGKNNKWGLFWSVNGGVQLASLIKIPHVEALKLSAGYGVTGQDAPNSYLQLLRYGTQGNFLVNGSWVPIYGPNSNSNPDLKWEKKQELNIGLDFTLLNSKLPGSADWYSNHTKDLLLNFPVPVPPNLYNREWINIGELANKGFELSLSYHVIQNNKFSWQTGVTFNRQLRSRIVTLSNKNLQFGNVTYLNTLGAPGLTSHNIFKVQEGGAIGQIWGPIFQGIKNGHWVFKDLNGDGKITEDDYTTIGNGLPKGSFGWSNSFNYKNWDLSFFFRGVFGHDLINTYKVFYQAPEQIGSYNILKSAQDIKTLTDPPAFSSYQVENASFVKLDNATLGYTFRLPSSSVRQLRVFLNGQNLFFITNYSGPDPEPRLTDPNDTGDGPLVPGVDRRDSWFTARKLSLGVDIKF